jgi:ABC-type nitrate/sulfonate/bicarbonate transport system substrate-binding protein
MSQPLDKLWYTRCPVPTGLGLAVQQGWLDESFAARCTRIESLRESNEQAVRESHFDHTLQNSVRHGGNIPAIWARSVGRETRVIGLSWSDEAQLILSAPESGIRSVRDLKGRRFGLPKWQNVQIDFSRAQALRGLENALSLEGLSLTDVELVDFVRGGTQSDAPTVRVPGTGLVAGGSAGVALERNAELRALLRGEVDAIFLKGASASHLAHAFGLHTVIDVGAHPEPSIRANNGTPRTLTVDLNLLDQHFDAAVNIVQQVLRADQWARSHPAETRRFLGLETNSSEYWVAVAYGQDAHERLRTDLADVSIRGLQDFSNFLHRQGFIPNAVDVRAWIDARPLEAARQLKLAA